MLLWIHLRPRCPLFERVEGTIPHHASILWRPCAYYFARTLFTRCCRLQCVTVRNKNQQSPKTDQFIPPHISDNVLKVEHTQRGVSAVHNSKNTRLRKSLFEQQSIRRYVAGMADTQGSQFETCWTTQELMHIKYAKKFSFVVMCLLYVQPLGSSTSTGVCEPLWSIHLNCQLTMKLKMMHVLQAQVCSCINTNNESGS